MGKTFSYDALDNDDYDAEESSYNDRHTQNANKRKVKRRLDDYLEQRQLRKNLGDDDFNYLGY
ncbi:MAG: hypothetical protein AAGJ17_01945 [Pseudomonadota bacterium]